MIEMARKTHSPKGEGSKSHIHLRDEGNGGRRSRKSAKERGVALASDRGIWGAEVLWERGKRWPLRQREGRAKIAWEKRKEGGAALS